MSLPPSKKRWFFLSLFVLAAVRLGLSTVHYNRLKRFIPQASETAPPDLAVNIGWCVSRAAKFVWHATCLTQALAAQYMLARLGYRSELRIGARRDTTGKIEAHAWLLSGGRIVIGGRPEELASYRPFLGFGTNLP